MPFLIKNRVGKGYPVYAPTVVNEKLKDDGSLNFDIIENENTHDLISAVSKMWTVHKVAGPDDKKIYVITIIDRKSKGDKQYLSITAREKEIDDLMVSRIYSNVTGSFTVDEYFKLVFQGTGYKFKIPIHVPSSRWENAGEGESRYDMFKAGLDRYGLEYEYDATTKTFTLKPFVSNTTKYYISSKVNANNIKLEEDASEVYTYIEGYGDFEEDGNFLEGGLRVKYTHPLAKVIGKRDAPPKIDGRIKDPELMKREIEAIIDQSLKTSLSLDFVSLREQFPDAIPRIGDLVPVRDDIIDVNDKVRIIEIRTKRDAHNRIINQDVVLGDQRRRDRYQKSVNNAATLANGLGGGSTGIRSINSVSKKIDATAKTVTKVTETSGALEYNGLGIHAKDGSKYLSYMKDGIKSSNDAGNNYTVLMNGDGFNMDAMKVATQSTNGLMSKEDKVKLDKISDTTQHNTNSLIITGENGKKYNITVNTSGQLVAKEV